VPKVRQLVSCLDSRSASGERDLSRAHLSQQQRDESSRPNGCVRHSHSLPPVHCNEQNVPAAPPDSADSIEARIWLNSLEEQALTLAHSPACPGARIRAAILSWRSSAADAAEEHPGAKLYTATATAVVKSQLESEHEPPHFWSCSLSTDQ
jgi:hypothetical protein